MAPKRWSIYHVALLGMLLLLALILGGCGTGVMTITPPAPTDEPIHLSSPTIGATERPIPTRSLTVGAGPSPTVACPPLAAASALPYPGRAGLAWYSELIVAGTVVAQETIWKNTTITTYSQFRVDELVRGLPVDEVRVAQIGGTLDGCTQQGSERPLERRVRLLLFLRRYEPQMSGSDRDLYYVNFRAWGISNLTANTTGTPTAQILTDVRQILSQPPPSDLSAYWIIPLGRAPLGPVSQATPGR